MEEIRGAGVRRFVLAPVAGYTHVAVSSLAVVLGVAGGPWGSLGIVFWLSWLMWRAARLTLRADASGLTVVNLLRSHVVEWSDVRGILVGHAFHDFPATLSIERRKGRLWGIVAHALLGVSATQRRAVALRVAEIGRTYGYGFPAGDVRDIEALHHAGLIDETDAKAHEDWWDGEERDGGVRHG